jgi:Protein of unknown function DUF262
VSLPKLQLESRYSPISEFYEPYRRDNWDLDPPYQRGSVWSDEQRRNLIKSLLMGLPTGAIIVNDRPFDPERVELRGAVIDGTQRILALRAFTDGQLLVPAAWFPSEELLNPVPDLLPSQWFVGWHDLSIVGHRRFSNIGIANLRAHVKTVEEEAEIYLLVNFGGVAQTETDRVRAAAFGGAQ